jgi:hypothetical protein
MRLAAASSHTCSLADFFFFLLSMPMIFVSVPHCCKFQPRSVSQFIKPDTEISFVFSVRLVLRVFVCVFSGHNGAGKCWGTGTTLMMHDGTSKKVRDH